MAAGSGPVVVPRILRLLAEELRLHSEYVIQHAVDAPALEPVLDDHAGASELLPQRNAERTLDAALTPDLRRLQPLQAAIQRKVLRLGRADLDLCPSTSTR